MAPPRSPNLGLGPIRIALSRAVMKEAVLRGEGVRLVSPLMQGLWCSGVPLVDEALLSLSLGVTIICEAFKECVKTRTYYLKYIITSMFLLYSVSCVQGVCWRSVLSTIYCYKNILIKWYIWLSGCVLRPVLFNVYCYKPILIKWCVWHSGCVLRPVLSNIYCYKHILIKWSIFNNNRLQLTGDDYNYLPIIDTFAYTRTVVMYPHYKFNLRLFPNPRSSLPTEINETQTKYTGNKSSRHTSKSASVME